ncbi:MAG: SLC13 family permease [Agathobacter sp.]
MRLKKEYIHYLVALAIGLVIFFCLPATGGLTEIGVRVIAITLPTLYLWLTTNTHWTSVMALGLLAMTQALTPNEVWAGSMGHFVVITIITYFMLNVCLKETGVINKIAIFFVTRKFVQGRPFAFFAMFFAANLLVGLFMDNMSLAIIFIGIAAQLCEEIGIEKGTPFYTCLFMGSLWCNCVYSITSPIAHAVPNIMMGLVEAQLGIVITYTQWLAVGVPCTIAMYFIILLVVKIWNPDATQFKNFDVDKLKSKYPPLDARGKFAAVVFIGVVAMVLLPSFLKGVFPVVWGYWNSVGVVVPAILAIVVLCVVQIGGKPMLDFPVAIKQVPMPAVIFAGTVCVLSVPLSSDVTGITAWMSGLLSPIFSNLGVGILIVLLCLCACIMTNFLSNTVTMVLFFNIGVALLAGGGTNMAMFGIVIAFAAALATLTPSAAVPSPLFFGPGYVTMKATLKYNVIFLIVSFVVLAVVGIPFITAVL